MFVLNTSIYFCFKSNFLQGRTQWDIKGFIPLKLSKMDLTSDAEYAVNLVNANYVVVNVKQCSFYMGRPMLLYRNNDIFVTDIIV